MSVFDNISSDLFQGILSHFDSKAGKSHPNAFLKIGKGLSEDSIMRQISWLGQQVLRQPQELPQIMPHSLSKNQRTADRDNQDLEQFESPSTFNKQDDQMQWGWQTFEEHMALPQQLPINVKQNSMPPLATIKSKPKVKIHQKLYQQRKIMNEKKTQHYVHTKIKEQLAAQPAAPTAYKPTYQSSMSYSKLSYKKLEPKKKLSTRDQSISQLIQPKSFEQKIQHTQQSIQRQQLSISIRQQYIPLYEKAVQQARRKQNFILRERQASEKREALQMRSPQLNRNYDIRGSFYERLTQSSERTRRNKAIIAKQELENCSFKPKTNMRYAQSKVKNIWTAQKFREMREEQEEHTQKSLNSTAAMEQEHKIQQKRENDNKSQMISIDWKMGFQPLLS